MKLYRFSCALWILLFAIASCGEEESELPPISVLSSTVNGSNSTNTNLNIPVDASIEIVFSSILNPAAFETAFSISNGAGITAEYAITYTNATSKVIATATLDYSTVYTVSIGTSPIGSKGERLAQPLNFSFTTAADDVIRSAAPCVSTSACLRSVELQGSFGLGTFEFYSNYPIYEDKAAWENLTQAIIVVHGASHDPENYYSWMTSTLQAESLPESTVLIAPYFRNTSTGSSEDFYWTNTDWRRGSQSTNSNKISSFRVIDELINRLADKDYFPVLDKIIVTGHSSGAAFTHVYAGANASEATHNLIDFEYVVANSQFFYYPDGQRIDGSNQLYTPSGCATYQIWPLGYSGAPPYLSGISVNNFNAQFVSRSITYLLGNGNQPDPTLNTTDCENTLQGPTRYLRGENMFRYMELVYPASHNHAKKIVNGVGHDGQGMYQSAEFKSLLKELLE